jgi:hypothetical protein
MPISPKVPISQKVPNIAGKYSKKKLSAIFHSSAIKNRKINSPALSVQQNIPTEHFFYNF